MKILFNQLFFEHNHESDFEGAYRIKDFSDYSNENGYSGENFLELVHTKRYTQKIKNACRCKGMHAEIELSPKSFDVACLAVGLTIQASEQNDFAIVRPPGHHAGIDLVEKIFNNTKSKTDQDHLPVVLLSIPNNIVDRTSFLIGEKETNPAYEEYEIIKKLELMGSSVIGIPCSTSHAPEIFNILIKKLEKSKSKVKLVHMIEEVSNYIKEKHPKIKKVGLLSTIGTYKSKIYSEILEKNNIDVITPTKKIKQDLVHNAIYNKLYGIKSQSNPVSSIAKAKLIEAVKYLQNQGAEAIILGCTEIPLAIKNKDVSNLILIDPTNILARSLIKETYPNKLK